MRTTLFFRSILAAMLLFVGLGAPVVVASSAQAASNYQVAPNELAYHNGRWINTTINATANPTTGVMTVNNMNSFGTPAYNIPKLEIYRYQYAGSSGAVRSALYTDTIVSTNHSPAYCWGCYTYNWNIPLRTPGTGYSGFVRVYWADGTSSNFML